jgi:hypothetical protein
MLQNKTWGLTLLIAMTISCSQKKENNTESIELNPTSFERALEQSKELLLLIKNNLIVIDSTNVSAQIVSHKLVSENNTYRTELTFGNISLKKVFKCTNDIINVVHFDFYYDSLSSNLKKDSQLILELIQSLFGEHTSIHSTGSMKTFTWSLSGNALDYEVFKNGFTFTVRKNKKKTLLAVEKTLPMHLKLAGILVSHIYNDSINFKSTALQVKKLFDVPFKGKTNSIAFNAAYDEKILLSGSFLFNDNAVSAIYFDYVYSDTISKQFILDSKLIKSRVSKLYGAATDVATVAYATTYKWNKTPIIIEVYSDGFSVLIENFIL